MTLTDRLGYAKYLFNVGKEYGDLVRGSVTGGAMLTFVANHLGVGPVGAVLIGVSLIPVTVGIAVITGYGIVRWRIVHATIEREWENNPYERAHIDTLRGICDHLRALETRP